MNNTQNYKRTVRGSVGAGIGSLVNGSGRTYYMLEHKTSSSYHNAGDTQKIIVDEIEIGRAATCQVRFDESFETVSRRHAAIVREGDNWKLVHLSESNPTLVNGRAIEGSYYLQSGDEIQLSVGGPRIGFIVPQGKQALTSSIGMTERLNLFRKQALRPYKRALVSMGVLLVLCIVGFSTALYFQHQNLLQSEVTFTQQMEESRKANLDLLDKYKETKEDLVNVQHEAAQGNRIAQRELNRAQKENERIASELAANQRNFYAVQHELNQVKEKLEKDTISEVLPKIEEVVAADGASENLSEYYKYIYTLKVDRIEVEYGGLSVDPGIPVTDIVCGTGFLLNDGRFITDRQNVEPWVYTTDDSWGEPWRKTMARYVACGCQVIIHYRAYSSAGTGEPLYFVNTDFKTGGGTSRTALVDIDRDFKKAWKQFFKKSWKSLDLDADGVELAVMGYASSSYAVIKYSGKQGQGIPFDEEIAGSLKGGTAVQMLGYAGRVSEHNPVISHFNDHINIDDSYTYSIKLQQSVSERGYYGSPAFLLGEDGKYRIIGMMVGSVNDRDRLVPIGNIH